MADTNNLAGGFSILGTIGVILAAWYMLRLFQGTMHGPDVEGTATPTHGVALRVNELSALLPLVALMVWIGVAPNGCLYPASWTAQRIISIVGSRY